MNTVKNTKKVTTFLLLCDFFVLLPYVITFLCSIFLLDGCSEVRFTSTVKNTKKGSNFFAFFHFSTIFG